jgi:prophage maintenance system killer protein
MRIIIYILGLLALYLALNGLSVMQKAKDMIDLAMGLIAISEALVLYFIMRAVSRHREQLIDLFE